MVNIRMQIKDSIMHYLCDAWNNHKRGKAHKENQALFDRKDGYAIWNYIDLEMIMEKVVNGIYAVNFADHDKQIRDKERAKILAYLVDNGYIKYGFDVEYLEEQLKGEQNESNTIVTFTLEQLEKHNKEFMDKARAEERERIIGELEKLKEDASHYNDDLSIGKESAYKKAIEIVRGGEND